MKGLPFINVLLFLFLTNSLVYAESVQDYSEEYMRYPKEKYIIGIGEVNKSGNPLRDRRTAEIVARLEIAKQIKVQLKEQTLDIACEGTPGKILGTLECKNEFVMVIEETVDEVLVGSRIVKNGERNGIVYAVAALLREGASGDLDKNMQNSIKNTEDSIEKAKKGDKDSLKKAREEYMKALTYKKEKEIIEGVKSDASEVFDDLEKELIKLKELQ